MFNYENLVIFFYTTTILWVVLFFKIVMFSNSINYFKKRLFYLLVSVVFIGIPPLFVFFFKIALFTKLYNSGNLFYFFLNIITNIFIVYFYFRFFKCCFFKNKFLQTNTITFKKSIMYLFYNYTLIYLTINLLLMILIV